MAENKFGKLSRLSLKTGIREEKTIVEDVAFTAPYNESFSEEKRRDLCYAALRFSGDHGRRQAGV